MEDIFSLIADLLESEYNNYFLSDEIEECDIDALIQLIVK